MPATTSASPSTIASVSTEGERLEADARLIIAPGSGVFEPVGDVRIGSPIEVGQIVGHLRSGNQSVPVVSPFAGRSGDALAWSGERLTAHQPVMWLSLDAGRP